MAKTTINIKADQNIKQKAQKVAKELGIPLSTIINAYLNQFVRTKEIHFSLLNPGPRKRIDRLSREALEGKNLSPSFKSAKDAIKYLNS